MAIQVSEHDDGELLSEINMIPLIDVMLVLLIVFIITIPVMKHAVQVNLPQASAEPLPPPPQAVRLSVTADGGYRWNDEPIDGTALEQRLQEIAALDRQPPLHLMGDKAVAYERVAQVLAAAQRAGVRSIGFVTEPTP
ncbi:biopolymer transporter ExbD [Tepidimonas taiwanensis]|uniref:Biopolymer transport protein ExbD n=1 Tax=Tepidimonas taiwanensis TaxID=307486 RepID=A0A554WZX7_9BURK|nr:biopolymer transporter ExbD [Tepidimonas taiwanensis]MCX7692165.1 biopolymer transporter ExbD [Tepidimonas taiwanensis]TSE29159.1 Biopolymer transport protein ExbD [Tepidimonas taiwanensis]UBQ06173.1 biopolymer transporter ExbD [Tepidimonas taiwanensis]